MEGLTLAQVRQEQTPEQDMGAQASSTPEPVTSVATSHSGSHSPGQESTVPAVSINKFKHFPAQQPEPLLGLHLCLINETVGHLHISWGLLSFLGNSEVVAVYTEENHITLPRAQLE